MKVTKQIATGFILLIVIASLYRIMPGRPYGFAPQWVMAIFAGAIIKNKKFAFSSSAFIYVYFRCFV